MNILGINDHHNSSAALLSDGKLICAMQEERFTRKKNFWGMPHRSIKATLEFAGLTLKDIDLITFAGQRHAGLVDMSREEHLELLKQLTQMDLLDTLRKKTNLPLYKVLRRTLQAWVLKRFPRYFHRRQLKQAKKDRLALLFQNFPEAGDIPIQFLDHHQCHFATAHFGAGHPEGKRLVFTNDGQGDLRCGSVTMIEADGTKKILSSINDRDSIAQIWAMVTLLMGFVPLEHEYKLMGMAPYSSSVRRERVAKAFENLFTWDIDHHRLKNNGIIHSFYIQKLIDNLNMIFRFERFDDICGGLQLFTERALTRWVKYWIENTGLHDICLSGGTFMNVKANLEIMKLDEVKKLFIFPSCGDETNAIGACYQSYFNKTEKYPEPLRHFYLGKEWTNGTIEKALKTAQGANLHVEQCPHIENRVADLLAKNQIVARFKGREEFGARALGNRSILANPSQWSVVLEINDIIKQRDFWMPFACSILAEDQHRYLKNPGKNDGQYMIMIFEGGPEIETIKAGAHPRDKTIRPQIVLKEQSPDYHALISAFKQKTGIGAVLNTSFNLHGYPLVHSPEDAIYVLLNSGLKYLALGQHLITKNS